jgi:hypothetical protein
MLTLNFRPLNQNLGKKLKMLFDFIFRQLRPLIFSGDAETAHERMLTKNKIK